MIKLADEMRQLINQARADETPCIMAPASPVGEPNAGFQGTMMVLDGESLAYRERGQLSALRHLEENPKVAFCTGIRVEMQGGSFGALPLFIGMGQSSNG